MMTVSMIIALSGEIVSVTEMPLLMPNAASQIWVILYYMLLNN